MPAGLYGTVFVRCGCNKVGEKASNKNASREVEESMKNRGKDCEWGEESDDIHSPWLSYSKFTPSPYQAMLAHKAHIVYNRSRMNLM